MAVKIEGEYLGELNTRMKHGPSGEMIITDAPVDNQGKGAYFSPTDLVAAATGSCMMTILAIVARRENIDISGMKVQLEKHMSEKPPRRISEIAIALTLPKSVPLDLRHKLELAAKACPVYQSLHPETKVTAVFRYE